MFTELFSFLQGLRVWQQIKVLHKSHNGCAATGWPSDHVPSCHLLFMKPTAASPGGSKPHKWFASLLTLSELVGFFSVCKVWATEKNEISTCLQILCCCLFTLVMLQLSKSYTPNPTWYQTAPAGLVSLPGLCWCKDDATVLSPSCSSAKQTVDGIRWLKITRVGFQ